MGRRWLGSGTLCNPLVSARRRLCKHLVCNRRFYSPDPGGAIYRVADCGGAHRKLPHAIDDRVLGKIGSATHSHAIIVSDQIRHGTTTERKEEPTATAKGSPVPLADTDTDTAAGISTGTGTLRAR